MGNLQGVTSEKPLRRGIIQAKSNINFFKWNIVSY